MSSRWRLSLTLLATVCVVLPGCKSRKRIEPVTVRIFSDLSAPFGPELDHRILDFEATNPRLSNGAAVQVGSANIADLPSALRNLDEPAADIVILNSPADVINFPMIAEDMAHAVDVCAAVHTCPAEVPALVPSKLQGVRGEAANKFVQFLASAPPQPASTPRPDSGAPPQSQPAQPNH